MRLRNQALAAAASLIVLISGAAGCAADDTARASASPSATSSSAAPAPSPLRAEEVDLKSARPLREVVNILDTRPILQGRETQGYIAIHGREALIDFSPETRDIQQGLILRDLRRKTEQRVVTRAMSDPDAGILSADLDAHWVVWMESTTEDYGAWPWVLFAYDRTSGRTFELARSPMMSDGDAPPPPPGWTGVVLHHGWVYWAQTTAGHQGYPAVDVYGCAVADCEPRRLARGAAFPQPTADGLYVVTSNAFRGDRDGTYTYTISRRDLVTGRELSRRRLDLVDDQAPNGFAARGSIAAVTVSDYEDFIQIIDLRGNAVLRIDSGMNGSFAYPVATSRYVLWAEGNSGATTNVGGYLWDLRDKRLYSVGNTAGLYNLYGEGDLVVWQESTRPRALPKDISYVVGLLP